MTCIIIQLFDNSLVAQLSGLDFELKPFKLNDSTVKMANALFFSFYAKQKDTIKKEDNWVSKLEKSARLKCKNYKETSEEQDKRKDDQEDKRKPELTDDWQVGC